MVILSLRPNKKISVFRVTGLEILGNFDAHIIFVLIIYFFDRNAFPYA